MYALNMLVNRRIKGVILMKFCLMSQIQDKLI